MARSLRKGPFVDDHAMKKVIVAEKASGNKPIKTWSRRSITIPDMIGLTLNTHNSKSPILVYITRNHIGYKLGEFAPTRTFKSRKGSTQKKIGK